MRKKLSALILCFAILFTGCAQTVPASGRAISKIDDKYKTFYEVFVYSFCDSNGDGIGDLNGLTGKLDYLNDGDDLSDSDLGIDAIWLMPIMPSGTYHKYDVENYMDIDEEYGTMADFDNLISECNKRGIDVIIDLVINHSSSFNPWFKEATGYIDECIKAGKEPNASECKYFDYYNFSNTLQSGYRSLSNGWYYEAQFDSRMPDMNLANESLRADIADIVDFWFAHGVSGFRLDAVKEFYSGNPTKNIETLTWFNSMVKEKKPDAYLVGECWTDMETYVKYYASGVDSFFNFGFAQAEGFSARAAKTSNKGLTAKDYAAKTEYIQQSIVAVNPNGIDAPFLSNHDMDRAAGYFSGDNAMYEYKMAGALNLMMSGNAFIYYGEEIGMKGSGTDPNRRAPMYWDLDVYAEGMTKGPSELKGVTQKYRPVNEQLEDASSILNFYKGLIKLRNMYPEIARGTVDNLEEYTTESVAVLQKTYNDSKITIMINVSAEAQTIDLGDISITSADWLYANPDAKGKDSVGKIKKGEIVLPAFSLVIVEME